MTKTDSHQYDTEYYRLFQSLLLQTSISLKVSEQQICTQASSLCEGNPCVLQYGKEFLSVIAGGRHCHALIVFEDNVEWLIRVPLASLSSASLEDRNLVLETEFGILKQLRATGLPVPAVFHWGAEVRTEKGLELGYLMMEKLPGKPLDLSEVRGNECLRRRFLNHLADFYAVLEKHTFNQVGSILSTGQIIGLPFSGNTQWTGPFSSFKTALVSLLDTYLAKIVSGELEEFEPIDAWLRHRWMRHQVEQLVNDEGPFFIKHPDDKGDHILVDDDMGITGIIDWELTTTVSKAFAFSSPCMLWPTKDFYEGSNSLSEDEETLALIWDERSRPDLADYVRDGRRLQRMSHCLEKPLSPKIETTIVLFRGLLSAFGFDISSEDWYNQWREAAFKAFAGEAGLQTMLH